MEDEMLVVAVAVVIIIEERAVMKVNCNKIEFHFDRLCSVVGTISAIIRILLRGRQIVTDFDES